MELLAPAGTMNSLIAAVENGADAVYAGATDFSARKSAGNFNLPALCDAIDYCHKRGAKLYLAMNTLVSDFEIEKAMEIVSKADEFGVDAVIVQDIGLSKLIRTNFNNLPLHASTQMTVHNQEGVGFLIKNGFKRVVLARECLKSEINQIKGLEVEVFCHGALCVCYSGQCLMSSIIGGRSGNRGACAQPCRLPYELDGTKGYFLSPKDFSIINAELPNVTSLKIEGRMKSPEYVALVCKVLREVLDTGKKPSNADMENLCRIFSRGGTFTDGWYGGHKGREMFAYKKANDDIHSHADDVLLKDIRKTFEKSTRKLPIEINFSAKENEKAKLVFGDIEVLSYENVLKAEKEPTSKARIEQQLLKLGESPFKAKNITIQMDDNIFIPISQINAMRREATTKLEEQIVNSFRREKKTFEIPIVSASKHERIISAKVWNEKQAKALVEAGIDRIYTRNGEFDLLPPISKGKTEIKGNVVVANNLYAVTLADKENKKYIADSRMNIFNSHTAEFFATDGAETVVCSPELTSVQINGIKTIARKEAVVYGKIPVMITNSCLLNCKGDKTLIDRKNAKLMVKCDKEACINTIYNSVPIFIADKLEELDDAVSLQLVFTDETPEECVKIYKMYAKEIEAVLPREFTRGHFFDKRDRRV